MNHPAKNKLVAEPYLFLTLKGDLGEIFSRPPNMPMITIHPAQLEPNEPEREY